MTRNMCIRYGKQCAHHLVYDLAHNARVWKYYEYSQSIPHSKYSNKEKVWNLYSSHDDDVVEIQYRISRVSCEHRVFSKWTSIRKLRDRCTSCGILQRLLLLRLLAAVAAVAADAIATLPFPADAADFVPARTKYFSSCQDFRTLSPPKANYTPFTTKTWEGPAVNGAVHEKSAMSGVDKLYNELRT